MSLLIILTLAALCVLLGFVAGRISTSPDTALHFELSDKALAHIAYEASRAYRVAHGDFSLKSWSNLHPTLRQSLTDRITAYRANPRAPDALNPFEDHLQAAIVALAG